MAIPAVENTYTNFLESEETLNRFATLSSSQLLAEEQESVVKLALDVLEARVQTGEIINSPEKVKSYLQLKLSNEPREVFGVLFLTTRHTIIAFETLFQGSINHTAVHPRIVAQRSLNLNATSVILAHNHPSGNLEPSGSDIELTKRLKDALKLVEVEVLDHIVVAKSGTCSLAESGVL